MMVKEMMVVIFHMFDRVSLTKQHNPLHPTDPFGSHAAGWW